MAGAKEIRSQIRSIQNTQKITKAMEMVAASKVRKAQNSMSSGRPYAENIQRVVGHVAKANSAFNHPFLEERDVAAVGFVVVSTDRGLCGGLNVNLFKSMIGEVSRWRDQQKSLQFTAFGTKGVGFLRRINARIEAQATHLGDRPRMTDVIGPVKVMLDAYQEGGIDRLFLASNQFINSMTQRPVIQQLLPIPPIEEESMPSHWDYIYEPDDLELMDDVLRRYVEVQIYQAVVENVACEMAARMVAMKSASDNAGELIEQLQLAYNKARQAAITQEIAEIVGGAAAV